MDPETFAEFEKDPEAASQLFDTKYGGFTNEFTNIEISNTLARLSGQNSPFDTLRGIVPDELLAQAANETVKLSSPTEGQGESEE